jgi:hypothetical protein
MILGIAIEEFITMTSLPFLSPKRREALKSYSPSLVGKGLGVRSVLDSTENRYIYLSFPIPNP